MNDNRGKQLEIRHGRKRKKGKCDETHQQPREENLNSEKNSNSSLDPVGNNNNVANSYCASNNNSSNLSNVKHKGEKRGGGGGGGSNNKFNFRAPQQFQISKKKNWNKRHLKGLYGCSATVSGNCGTAGALVCSGGALTHLQISKADVENLPNIKNQISHHRQGGCNNSGQKNMKQQQSYAKKKILSGVGGGILSIRSKFFLSDKRPRKECIIPPTKFLLGGNISDPLNLNSLQEEAQSGNATPSTTPRQSPVTTPPKIEVIIPPNIHDPLHLLDPVDSIEYEKQLVSPMKRRHRHRKKKPKRKRLISNASGISMLSTSAELNFASALSNILKTEKEGQNSNVEIISNKNCDLKNNNNHDNYNETKDLEVQIEDNEKNENFNVSINTKGTLCANSLENEIDINETSSFPIDKRRNEKIDKISKELKLDLELSAEQHKQNMMNSGRKRKSSEAGSCKTKFRRIDSMDKIVSPVVPQPGAWKRPPRNTPTGARKSARIRSVSNSETDLISPTDDSKTGPGQKAAEDSVLNKTETENKSLNNLLGALPTVQETDEQNEQKGEQMLQSSLPKFKSDGAKYQYGNYDRYSGFNTVNEFIDIRLQVFQRNADLFVNKDVLDIGCNVGHMTIAVAKKLSPKSILGIDIDPKLISRARRNISLYVRIPKEDDESLKTPGNNSNAFSISVPVAAEDVKNALEQKLDALSFKEVFKKRLEELQKSSAENNKKISKSKLKRKIYFEIKRKNKIIQSQKYAEQRRIDGSSLEIFPISFPICYGAIPSLEQARLVLHNSPLTNTVENYGSNSTGSSGGGGNINLNVGISSSGTNNHSNNSANATPARSLGAGGTTGAGSSITVIKSIRNNFPKNVFFRQCNYVLNDENSVNNEQQQYDLILCLSVTKWIHLNFGDNGLKLAFKRMFNQLRPGGKLILEAQNWASYKKKKNLTETIYKNYNSIEFFPNKFHEYLLSNEVGFSHSYTLGVPRHMSKGFCRPIQLYAKGDFTPNHVRWSDAHYPQTPYEAYRGIYASVPRPPYPLWGSWDLNRTPRGNSSSCRQTPYYNPLETDSYLPSYDTEVLNRHYVFASPLYQTVWSPPASLRNSSSHTPVFGSVREVDNDSTSGGSNNRPRHVYLPNDESQSPKIVNGAFNSIREEAEQDSNSPARQHVYANCDSSSSPHDGGSDNDQILTSVASNVTANNTMANNIAERSQEIVSDSNDSETI
ncbi:7SK snRNA methylphosphate capping enzyme bin3 [Condylostylus longicornis]|uniref:7SK snRNA methylphosphate capping enzyme bin3 n=1 Tax=Condylostylus longicornis TaxID=2530218 RepID=UPI00244E3350|nr:7SK snRNA methylphosphate capping enzyme bin3 [Condylostylus longicornis]XP_055372867.1 7SK snRNA methylphosphate capping enzyme bin3 [Condylostylus longicornis]